MLFVSDLLPFFTKSLYTHMHICTYPHGLSGKLCKREFILKKGKSFSLEVNKCEDFY